MLGYRSTNHFRDTCDLAVHFQPQTFADPQPLAELNAVPVVLNRRCTDVSKTRVQEAFAQIFGYPLAVDPTRYQGLLIEKSDENYRHDGRIIRGPVQTSVLRDGCVYQRLVRHEDGTGHVVDIRVPIYGGQVPFAYKKVRTLEDRFGNTNKYAEIHEAHQIFTREELAQLARLADELGVDYAEMDVLRDNDDGRIYVVDVNNTPAGPANGLTPEDRKEAIRRLSQAFEELIEDALR